MNIEQRLAALKMEWVSLELFSQLYGIALPEDLLMGRMRSWANNLRRPKEVDRPDAINRHGFEAWLQWGRLLPTKLGAARLGMSSEALLDVLSVLDDRGLLIHNTENFSDQIIAESLIRDMPRFFPRLKQTVFADNDDQGRALHEAIRSDLGMTIDPLICETSRLLGEPRLAYSYDVLTDEPVSLQHQVWLKLGKPIHLAPDVCSRRTYATHEALLAPLLFSANRPEVPDVLRAA